MTKKQASHVWFQKHVNDYYVSCSRKEGYRARAAYKLLEINEKDQLIRSGTILADLGSAPGSWSQVAASLVGEQGRVFALDVLPMSPIAKVEFLQGDLREQAVLDAFVTLLEGRKLDLVISDMAPNISGTSATDQARSFSLAELALEFTHHHLKSGGHLLVKVFQGSEFPAYLEAMKGFFSEVVIRKPKASRGHSNEIYLLGKRRR